MGETTGRTGDVQSVQRALNLLEIVSRVGEIGLSELAREAGLAVSTTHSLVRTLARRHYVTSNGGRYRLGSAVTVLTSSADPMAALGAAVEPVLNEVAATSGWAATATVLVGRDAKKIGYVPAPGPVTATANDLGWTEPLRMATGRVLVALTRESEWLEFIARTPDVERGWSRRRWLNELRGIQRSGIAWKPAQGRNALIAMAVPIWTHGGSVVASIGCSAPAFLATSQSQAETLTTLRQAAVALSAELGCAEVPLPLHHTPQTDTIDELKETS